MHFAVAAPDACGVRVDIFEHPHSLVAQRQIPLDRDAEGIFRGWVADLDPGTLYGLRVDGPYAPQRGLRFNPAKLLVDPYARAITGQPRASGSLFGYHRGDSNPLSYNGDDSAGAMPKCIVVDGGPGGEGGEGFDWQGTQKPRVPWSDTVIYEAHVKGLTQRHPEVDVAHRGTYLGVAAPAMIEHWQRLGVTSVQLMPVQQIASETHLLDRGGSNYWGYSTLGFLAPHNGYATVDDQGQRGWDGRQVVEFKTMVRELHRAGLEVLLDVVYNHTPEGDHRGPTLSLKGVDNRGFYRLRPRAQERTVDFTGCGNSLDVSRPAARRLVLDSLRYWADEMQVDGFRFDLATFLGRQPEDFTATATLFEEITSDPLLGSMKCIAEPWDLGPGGYRLGHFPSSWYEWNDRFRQDVRRFWRGDGAGAAAMASRLGGSEDVFGRKGRPTSINYVVSHDGFTLADLVSYDHKHNAANGEDNRDGSNDDTSFNWGHEGPTDDPQIRRRRLRTRRNLMASLVLSRGVPMLAQGDELGHSQGGNNNPYCQDNELTWLDWSAREEASTAQWMNFLIALLQLRRAFGGLSQQSFLTADEVRWLADDGSVLEPPHWRPELRCFAMHWRRPGAEAPDAKAPDTLGLQEFLLLINGRQQTTTFQLPEGGWFVWLDTANESTPKASTVPAVPLAKTSHRDLAAFSQCLLGRVARNEIA